MIFKISTHRCLRPIAGLWPWKTTSVVQEVQVLYVAESLKQVVSISRNEFMQAARLQEQICPASEETALTKYQHGTLEYARGRLSQAFLLCQDSLELARRLYKKESHSQVPLFQPLQAAHYLPTTETSKLDCGAIKSPSIPPQGPPRALQSSTAYMICRIYETVSLCLKRFVESHTTTILAAWLGMLSHQVFQDIDESLAHKHKAQTALALLANGTLT